MQEHQSVLDQSSYSKPESAISYALPFKKLKLKFAWQSRVIFFDPAEIYQRLPIDYFKRLQSQLVFKDMFPDRQTGFCSCGCGSTLAGRRRRWATDDCAKFALAVWAIIDGQAGTFNIT